MKNTVSTVERALIIGIFARLHLDKHRSLAIDLFDVCVLFIKDSINSKMECFIDVQAALLHIFFSLIEENAIS